MSQRRRPRWTSVDPWLAESFHMISKDTKKTLSELTDIAFADFVRNYEKRGKKLMNDKKDTKIILIGTPKGGTGKTTSTVNIAFQLQRKGFYVCVVDADPQGDTSKFFGYDNDRTNKKSMVNYVRDLTRCIEDEEPYANVVDYCRMPLEYSRIDVLPNDSRGNHTNEDVIIASQRHRVNLYQVLLEQLKTNGKYDYVLVDTQPSIDGAVQQLYAAADYVLIPTLANRLSIDNMVSCYHLVRELRKKGSAVQIGGIFFTQIDPRLAISKTNIPDVYEQLPRLMFNTKIRMDAHVGHAENDYEIVSKKYAATNASMDYSHFVDELLTRLKELEKPVDEGQLAKEDAVIEEIKEVINNTEDSEVAANG